MCSYTSPNHCYYFYGRLLRDESEKILKKHGASNGLFLLRERLEETGSYVVSVCYDRVIGHYKIDRQQDGTVRIDKGKKFIGPIELVKYHETEADGLVTELTKPCNRNANIEPICYLFVYNSELHQNVEKEIKNKSHTQAELKDARGRFRFKYEQEVLKKIHLSQNWFIKNLDREQAVKLLIKSGLQDGKFLVRFKDQYKISVCYRKEVKHYEINSHYNKYSLEGGKEFETIIQLVDYYHRCNDGLLVKLLIPYTPYVRYILEDNITGRIEDEYCSIDIYESNTNYVHLLDGEEDVQEPKYVDDEPINQNDVSDLGKIPASKRSLFQDEDNYIYDFTPKFLAFEDIKLYDELGSGNFGVVTRGTYFIRNESGENTFELPVAVKILNSENEESSEESLKEAETMISLKHKNIIKLIGVISSSNSNSGIMIVLELAKLGNLGNYLRSHKNMEMLKIIDIVYQVSLAMEYLHSCRIVHRDLAARNILLASENIAKISDFGMSRKKDLGEKESFYYYTRSMKRWPLKWYPPETSLTRRFDEKSDVWSFAIMCWEATSYGGRPYQGIDINTLVWKLQNGHRLDKPQYCPDEIYNLMYCCWNDDKLKRPIFKEIVKDLKNIINELYK